MQICFMRCHRKGLEAEVRNHGRDSRLFAKKAKSAKNQRNKAPLLVELQSEVQLRNTPYFWFFGKLFLNS